VRATLLPSHSQAMTTPLNGAPAGGVAIVTGGSRGVGRAIVQSLASSGYAVVVDYLHHQHAAESTIEMLLADNAAAVAVRADVTDELDVERLFAETTEAFGGIDVVVHAVRSRVTAAPVASVDLAQFDALCRLNTRAAFIVNREAARRLRTGGAIINLTSSVVSSPCPSYGALAATTAAIDALTRVLALELHARDITVNAISLQVDAPCTPHTVADAVTYLLSNHGHRLTGQVIPVDVPR
jgi:3-oxoacyl-[acyl-carrier protein] reductase